MGSKTKIVVFKMRELIYTGIFVTLGIILIILFIFMFTPRDKEKAKDDQPTQTTAAMKYVAGVYTTPITLNDNAIDVEVVVDQDHINSIRLVNLSDTVTTMYPLVQPALEKIASQIYDTQSTDGITYSQDSKYTSQILLDAIDSALETAQVKTEEE